MESSSSPFEHYLDTDYAPNVNEINEINEYISTQQVTLDETEIRLAALNQLCRELENTRRVTAETISRHHNLTTLVRRLPPEILAVVFLFLPCSTPDLSLHPVVAATHVCQQWRRIALAIPLLCQWTHIAISTPTRDLDGPQAAVRWMNHLEASCSRAVAFLQRSGGCSLHVTIAVQDLPQDRTCMQLLVMIDNEADGGFNHVFGVFQAMMAKSWLSTQLCFTLHPEVSVCLNLLDTILPHPGGFGDISFEIGYTTPTATGDGAWDGVDGPLSLRETPVTSLKTKMGIAEIRRIDIDWKSLTELCIVSPALDPSRRPFLLADTLEILAKTPNLVILTVDMAANLWEPPPQIGPRISLPRLKRLTIRGDCPPVQLAECLQLPALIHLSASPRTRHDPEDEANSALLSILRNYGHQLVEVSFDYQTLTQTALAYALNQLRNVEVLELTTYDRAVLYSSVALEGLSPARLDYPLDSVIKKLTPTLDDSQTSLGTPHCPRVRRLTMALSEANGEARRDVLALIEGRRRVERDFQSVSWLERVEICFDRGSVDGMREALRSRGVDTREIQFAVRNVYSYGYSQKWKEDVQEPIRWERLPLIP